MSSHLDPIPGPAFDPDELTAALLHAEHLEMVVHLSDGLDAADEVIFVGPFWIKPGTPQGLWHDRIEWYIQRLPDNGAIEVSESSVHGAIAHVATPSAALDYIARTRLLREAAGTRKGRAARRGMR